MKRWKWIAMCAALLGLGGIVLAADAPPPPRSTATRPRAIFPPFAHAPLDGPLVITGTFGEYRPGRFHAGLDYSTGGNVGMPVYAPLDGWIERIRTSGAGYGRSIYVHAPDGRTILLGHLDAYDEPFASYVAAAQDSSGQYEQDLWPPRDRFPVHEGQRLGWSGQSGGIGEPHLHLEVRRGDMAINPLLAGASAEEDTLAPVIAAIVIEPRSPVSRVNGGTAPVHLALGARTDTVNISGYARVEVDAHDPGLRRSDMQPYEIEMKWADHSLACRFDSLSWATDMNEGDLIYDRGRLFEPRAHAVLLWRGWFGPRAIVTDIADHVESGALGLVEPGRAERVSIIARDFAGHETQRVFLARIDTLARFQGTIISDRLYPEQHVLGGFGWRLTYDMTFGDGAGWESESAETLGTMAGTGDLVPVGRSIHLGPDWMPLRRPFDLRASVPVTRPDRRLGLYVRRDSDWEMLTTQTDTSWSERAAAELPLLRELWRFRSGSELKRPAWIAHPTHLGTFAFFEDRIAPRIELRKPPRHRGTAEPYSRWALEARLTEAGSGVDARASYLIVDRKRRPTEWDGVHQMLRWKPLAAPRAGAHRYVVVACDRAGNTRRVAGRFVIN